jgi:hypothetical protein
MKFLYSIALIFGTLFGRINSIPIIYEPQDTNTNTNLDPAIVVTSPPSTETPLILYDPEGAIAPPPPPPPAPPGPIFSVYEYNETHSKLVLPSGEIIYTPLDIIPFLMSPFSDLEPVVVKPRMKQIRIESPVI